MAARAGGEHARRIGSDGALLSPKEVQKPSAIQPRGLALASLERTRCKAKLGCSRGQW
jgi:hypothetical protein